MAGVPVLVVVSGMGMSEAAICASEVIRLFDPCGVIGFGTAGALSETWAIGKSALVSSAAAYQPPRLLPLPAQNPPRPTLSEARSDKEWLKVGQEQLHLPAVKVGSANEPVTNAFLARHLATVYGFDWVDCESHSVLDVAARHGVRAAGFRTVSDHCGPETTEPFEDNARRALRDAARWLEKFVGALYEAQLLGPRT